MDFCSVLGHFDIAVICEPEDRHICFSACFQWWCFLSGKIYDDNLIAIWSSQGHDDVPCFRLVTAAQGPQVLYCTTNMASIDTSHALKQFDDLVTRGELFYTPSKPVIINDNGLDVSISP